MIELLLIWLGLVSLAITLHSLTYGMLPHEWACEKIKELFKELLK